MPGTKSRVSRILSVGSVLALSLPAFARAAAGAQAAPAAGAPELFGVPVDFFLFGLTLLGAAVEVR